MSALSTVGVTASLGPPKPSSDIDAAFAGRDGKRLVNLAVIGGLCVVGVLALVLFMQGGAKPAEPAARAKTTSSAIAAAPAEAPRLPPAVELKALPVEGAPTASVTPDVSTPELAKKTARAAKTSPVAPLAPPPAASTATAPSPKAWKQDPGF